MYAKNSLMRPTALTHDKDTTRILLCNMQHGVYIYSLTKELEKSQNQDILSICSTVIRVLVRVNLMTIDSINRQKSGTGLMRS